MSVLLVCVTWRVSFFVIWSLLFLYKFCLLVSVCSVGFSCLYNFCLLVSDCSVGFSVLQDVLGDILLRRLKLSVYLSSFSNFFFVLFCWGQPFVDLCILDGLFFIWWLVFDITCVDCHFKQMIWMVVVVWRSWAFKTKPWQEWGVVGCHCLAELEGRGFIVLVFYLYCCHLLLTFVSTTSACLWLDLKTKFVIGLVPYDIGINCIFSIYSFSWACAGGLASFFNQWSEWDPNHN